MLKQFAVTHKKFKYWIIGVKLAQFVTTQIQKFFALWFDEIKYDVRLIKKRTLTFEIWMLC